MITLAIISIVYALIRAKHDSYILTGEWKAWAFVEGVFLSLTVSYLLHDMWYMIGIGALLFGIVFWIVFDCMVGIYFGKHPLYIGNTGFDAAARKMFAYTEKWKGLNYLIFKLVWLTIIIGAYISLNY